MMMMNDQDDDNLLLPPPDGPFRSSGVAPEGGGEAVLRRIRRRRRMDNSSSDDCSRDHGSVLPPPPPQPRSQSQAQQAGSYRQQQQRRENEQELQTVMTILHQLVGAEEIATFDDLERCLRRSLPADGTASPRELLSRMRDELYNILSAASAEAPPVVVAASSSSAAAAAAGERTEPGQTLLPISACLAKELLPLIYYADVSLSAADVCVRLGRSIKRKSDVLHDVLLRQQQEVDAEDAEVDGNAIMHSIRTEPVSQSDLANGVLLFSDFTEELNARQSFFIFLLREFFLRGYRRIGSDVYEPFFYQQRDTRTYVRVGSISQVIFSICRREVNFEYWRMLTGAANNAHAAAEHLASCCDEQFLDVVKERGLFSFRNGFYVAADDLFIPHERGHELDGRVGRTVSACRFFDADFFWSEREEEIETPALMRILECQKFSPDVVHWMLVLLGRLLYPLHQLDEWQVIPFFKGVASSGKSTILNSVCQEFFSPEDVGVLSNNIESKFGLSGFSKKYVFIAPEIKADIKLDQAEFQSIVSGEMVQLAEKFKTAVAVKWNVPGIMAGNELPDWTDKGGGSISRRIVVFPFAHAVQTVDSSLGKRLRLEVGKILVKSNRAYLSEARRVVNIDVWTVLPQCLQAERQKTIQETNPLREFVDQCLHVDPDECVTWEVFANALRTFNARRPRSARVSCNRSALYLSLIPFNIKLDKDKAEMMYRNHVYTDFKVNGCDVRMATTRHGGGGDWQLR